MKRIIITTLITLTIVACRSNKSTEKEQESVTYSELITTDYELHKPSVKAKAVVVLFGGYPESATDIKREFKILEAAKKSNMAILFSNFNQKLWLEEIEKEQLANVLVKALNDNQLPLDNLYFGGFSSGGDVALLQGNYLNEKSKYHLVPKGVFIVDSPIDLAALYSVLKRMLQEIFRKYPFRRVPGYWRRSVSNLAIHMRI